MTEIFLAIIVLELAIVIGILLKQWNILDNLWDRISNWLFYNQPVNSEKLDEPLRSHLKKAQSTNEKI